ncbi:cytochrome o ubiquinol oxidase subunit III [Paenibacillus gansuensis]|uniref:Cytochrome bo(3) ubiquinol oxidase subunit 3 n=1 Tax=Paenibacillus gansuensis TaxID=306542 RepID=A0ABW5PJF3_9BACL
MANSVSHEAENGHGHDGHHDQEELRQFGFWIFLMTDVILFSVLFATYLVLNGSTNGGPGTELFEINGIIVSTFVLLTSSFTSGLAVLAMNQGKKQALIGWLLVTALLGAVFIGLEATEFIHLVHEGATMGTSAFWSAFFTLVGTHGLHVSIGLVWMAAIMLQLKKYGINPVTKRKVNIVSLYWHFLDVVWIFVFTIVYLMGVM